VSRKKLGRKYKPARRKASECLSRPFHNPNFLLAQAVQLIHEIVDLPVRGCDLALERGLVVLQFGCGELLVQRGQIFVCKIPSSFYIRNRKPSLKGTILLRMMT